MNQHAWWWTDDLLAGLHGRLAANSANNECDQEFERYRHATHYLQSRFHPFDNAEALRRIGALLGFNTGASTFMAKIRARTREWNALREPVPLLYLDSIGAVRAELEACIETDIDCFEVVARRPRYPRNAVVRMGPCACRTIRFREGTSELEALAVLAGPEVPPAARYLIYPELLTIHIAAGASSEPVYHFREPSPRWTRGRLEP